MMTKTLVEFSTLEMNVCVRKTLVRNRKTSLPKVENLVQTAFMFSLSCFHAHQIN